MESGTGLLKTGCRKRGEVHRIEVVGPCRLACPEPAEGNRRPLSRQGKPELINDLDGLLNVLISIHLAKLLKMDQKTSKVVPATISAKVRLLNPSP